MYGYGFRPNNRLFGGGGANPLYTARTTAFATATGITDTTILNALIAFDTGMINNSLDTKMKAIYPFVGGTATTHKFNFMDSRDLDIAFRLQFNGGGTHSATGYQANGTNAYANTFLSPLAQLSQNNNAFGFYSRTEANAGYYDMGAYTYGIANVILSRFSGNYHGTNADDNYNPSTNSSSLGLFTSSRTSNTVKKGYRNNVEIQNSINLSTGLTHNPYYIGATSGAALYSARQFAFAFISSGLTSTEVGIFSNLVQTLQTSLSRNV